MEDILAMDMGTLAMDMVTLDMVIMVEARNKGYCLF
jgi:hypothetical protein